MYVKQHHHSPLFMVSSQAIVLSSVTLTSCCLLALKLQGCVLTSQLQQCHDGVDLLSSSPVLPETCAVW